MTSPAIETTIPNQKLINKSAVKPPRNGAPTPNSNVMVYQVKGKSAKLETENEDSYVVKQGAKTLVYKKQK